MFLLYLLTVVFISCGESKQDKELLEANALIDSLNKKRISDSIDIEQNVRYEIAKKELEYATGKKDTLTKSERLEKAKEMFK